MTDQKSSWLQRLVGADGGPAVQALEDQANRAKEDVLRLSQELAQEREKLFEREARLEQLEAQARAAEADFEARLVAVRQASQAKLDAADDLERKHKQVVSELLSTRTQHKRLAEEKEKLIARQREDAAKQSQALDAATAQAKAHEGELQAAKSQLTELKTKVIAESSEAQKAREQARERERMSEVNAKELAEARRKLQALETRASTIEHELSLARQAGQSSDSTVEQMKAELAATKARRDLAMTMAGDLWRALGRVVGEGAALALVLGVEADGVPKVAGLAEASVSLKRAFESQALCQSLKVEAVPGGVQVELRAAELSGSAVAAPWLMASVTRFLEKASGIELAVDTSSVDRDTLRFRLSESAPSRTAS